METDPDKSQRVMDRLDGRHYGEPEKTDKQELHGVAPLCDSCHVDEAVETVDEDNLCADCLDNRERASTTVAGSQRRIQHGGQSEVLQNK
jgi:hypothetical protein